MDVLTCVITIGDENPDNPLQIDNPIELREVLNIQINDSYKTLIGTAKLTFPKGTIFRSTIIADSTAEGKEASSLTSYYDEKGTLIEKRNSYGVISEASFKVGQRINIKLGYNGDNKNMFDGYIVSYNSNSIFEIECENLAYKLKMSQCPTITTPAKGTKLNDVCGEKYGLLKDTGFELHPETKKFDIDIGQIDTNDNLTVADVLHSWSNAKLYCFLKYDDPTKLPKIAIGRPYASYKSDPIFPESNTFRPYEIDFNYHVAEDGLKVVKTDPMLLAVVGKALGVDNKMFSVTVRLNPEYKPGEKGSEEFQVLHATKISKKTHKITGNITAKGADSKNRVNLSTYTIIPYMSPNMQIDSNQLVDECKAYFKQYTLSGITGTLTLFGDFGLRSAEKVKLNDPRNVSKNATYITEEVVTEFGTGGYRQTIKIPHKLKSSNDT